MGIQQSCNTFCDGTGLVGVAPGQVICGPHNFRCRAGEKPGEDGTYKLGKCLPTDPHACVPDGFGTCVQPSESTRTVGQENQYCDGSYATKPVHGNEHLCGKDNKIWVCARDNGWLLKSSNNPCQVGDIGACSSPAPAPATLPLPTSAPSTSAPSTTAPSSTFAPTFAPTTPPPQPPSAAGTIFIVILIILILAAIGGGVFLAMKRFKKINITN